MIPPSLPPNEAERLRALCALGLLDTPAEERFDRVTRLALAIFDVPIALVSLVDADRQWFKSRQGLEVPETKRALSFCGHAIRGPGLFIIPDAARDERFADNPLVAGSPDIRFYAGAPLAAPDGHRIGTLCLIDRRPRELDPEQRRALRDLGDIVQDEIAYGAARKTVRQDGRNLASRRRAARLKVLAAFGVALGLLATFSIAVSRAERRLVADSTTGAGSVRAAADGAAFSRLLVLGGASRAAVLVLVLAVLLFDMSAREKVEDALRRTRDEALEAAEGRRVAQAEAEKLGERLTAVLDHVDVGIAVVEIDGTASLYNVAAERIHRAWRDEMERLFRAGTHPVMREDEKTIIASGDDPLGLALKGETVRGARVFFRTPFRPEGYHLTVSAVPLRDPRGLLTGAVLMFSERARA